MKKHFPGYYRPDAEELEQKFKECIFCFDTNIMLNLYRYTPESRDNLINVLKTLKNRVWLPHQAGLEYQRNRTKVLLGQIGLCSALEEMIDVTIEKVQKLRRSNLFTVNTLIEPINKDLGTIKGTLQEKKEKKPDLMTGDPVFDAVTELFEGKVGKPYKPEEYKEIYKKGKERYENKIPPGYMDSEKNPNDTNQFGDLVLWFQILDYAKDAKLPIILITDDAKEDWWREVGGEKLGPRPELIDEFIEVTGGGKWFYMYSTEQFLKYAKEYLNAEVTPQAINEAESIEKQDAVIEKVRLTEVDSQAVEAIAQARALDEALGFVSTIPSEELQRDIVARISMQSDAARSAFEQSMQSDAVRRAQQSMMQSEALRKAFEQSMMQSDAVRRAQQSVLQSDAARKALEQSMMQSEALRKAFEQSMMQSDAARKALEQSKVSIQAMIEKAVEKKEKKGKGEK